MSDTQQTTTKSTTWLAKLFWGVGILIVAIGVLGTSLLATLAGLAILPITGKLLHSKLKVKKPVLVQFIALIVVLTVGMFTLGKTTPTKAPSGTPSEQTATAVFDVPSLVGKSLSELETTLGTPTQYSTPRPTNVDGSKVEMWEKTWSKNGYSLMVEYKLDTNEVVDLFLGADSDAVFESFKDKNNILKAGGMSENGDLYSVEFVKALKDPNAYTGAIIRKK